MTPRRARGAQARTASLARALTIPLIAAVVAASCGGDDGGDAGTGGGTLSQATGSGGEPTGDPGTTGTGGTGGTGGDELGTGDPGAPTVETIPPEPDARPVSGGTLRYGLEADTDGLNPAASRFAAAGVIMGNAVFDTLAATTADGGWVPYLAESFTPNGDFTAWTVALRPGITFHDGTPLNAAAVVANFEAQRGDLLVGLTIRPFYPEQGAVEVVDDLTVTYHLLDANAHWPATMNAQLGMMASPTWLADAKADPKLNQHPIGTGPFIFDSRSEDSVTRFVRNPDWWGGEVHLDAVEFYSVPDPQTRADLMFGGELDAQHTTDAQSILDLRDDGSIQSVLDDTGEEFFAMMNTEVPPFDDVRARQALAYATPRQTYLDLIGLGVLRAADQRFTPESPFHDPAVRQVGDDPDRAAALAAEYCAERGGDTNPVLNGPACTDGKINIELQWSGPSVSQTRIAELLDEGWGGSFNVTFNELFQDEHISQTALGQYNVDTWRQFGADDPSYDNLWLMCRTVGGVSLNWPRYCDPERDTLLLQAQAELDDAARATLYQQVEQRINEAFTYVFLNHTMWDNAFAENVHGVCERTAPSGELLRCASNGATWFSSVWIG